MAMKYREIGAGVDFDGWFKITLERIDGRIVKVSRRRVRELRDADRLIATQDDWLLAKRLRGRAAP